MKEITKEQMAIVKAEVWKPVVGYEGMYEVSNLGRVKSVYRIFVRKDGKKLPIRERILKHANTSSGYPAVRICGYGKKPTTYIHRLVAGAFIDNPENKPCVNHINGIKTDNRVDNLEWCSYQENEIHSRDTGLNKSKTKIIINTETGIFYSSARLAAESLGMNRSTLLSQLNGNNPNKTTLKYI